jgi:hypothetical protein
MGRGLALFIFTILFSMISFANCAESIGSCEYYQCIEKQENCGAKSYYTNFGLHYCKKYHAEQSNYTERGQEFLINIRTCLQVELERERIRTNELPRCSKVKKFAIRSHKLCYQQYEFCKLPKADRRRIEKAAKKEIIHPQMFLFALWLEKSCLF